jgi:hypothetical protein
LLIEPLEFAESFHADIKNFSNIIICKGINVIQLDDALREQVTAWIDVGWVSESRLEIVENMVCQLSKQEKFDTLILYAKRWMDKLYNEYSFWRTKYLKRCLVKSQSCSQEALFMYDLYKETRENLIEKDQKKMNVIIGILKKEEENRLLEKSLIEYKEKRRVQNVNYNEQFSDFKESKKQTEEQTVEKKYREKYEELGREIKLTEEDHVAYSIYLKEMEIVRKFYWRLGGLSTLVKEHEMSNYDVNVAWCASRIFELDG